MTAKEYLQQAFDADRRIKSKERQIEILKSHAEYSTPQFDCMPHGSASCSSALETSALKIVELKNELAKQIDNYLAVRRKVSDVIKAVNNSEYEAVLEMRYLSFMGWKEIMSVMGYSRSYVYELHGRALQCVHVPD